MIKNKEKFNKFLLNHGIEVRYIYYRDCERIFNSKVLNVKIPTSLKENYFAYLTTKE